jgi:hypothetical protein
LRIETLARRIRLAIVFGALTIFGLSGAARTNAQNPDTIPAEESAARTKTILQQMIGALGGAAYLNLHDSECTGRIAQFGQYTGELGADAPIHEVRMPPDKLRREVGKKLNIIDVYNGNQGWSLDKGGVEDGNAVGIANFQAGLKMSFDNLIRSRLAEPGMYFHYGGEDVVDLRQVDWVQLEDTDGHMYKIAVEKPTRLPVRFVIVTRNPRTNDTIEDVTRYSNWHTVEGIATPFQVSRERDGKRVSQVFYDGCKYNSGITADFFTREALAKRWAEMGHKTN